MFLPQTSCTPALTPRPFGEKRLGAGRWVHWPVDPVSDAWTIPRVPSSEKPGLFYTKSEYARWRRELEDESRGMAAPAEEVVTAENRDIVGKGVAAGSGGAATEGHPHLAPRQHQASQPCAPRRRPSSQLTARSRLLSLSQPLQHQARRPPSVTNGPQLVMVPVFRL